MQRKYYVAEDVIFIESRNGTLAFSPPIPAWVWVGEDSKKALELLLEGKETFEIADYFASKYKTSFELERSQVESFFEQCPVVTKNKVEERSQRSHIFTNLNSVWLCPSGWCNMSCVYCAVDPSGRKPEQKSLDFWINVVQESLSLGATDFVLSGGEPSIYPKFVELIEWINANTSASISVLTNGFAYTDEMIDRISKTRTNIQISIDGIKSETHDKIRGKGSFEKAVSTFKRFQEKGVQPMLSMTICKHNLEDIDSMPDFAKNLGCQSVRMAPHFDMGRGIEENEANFTQEEREDVTLRILRLKRERKITVSCSVTTFEGLSQRQKNDHCGAAHGLIAINYDGGVYPCTDAFQMEHECAGFAGSMPLSEIINHPTFARIRGDSIYFNTECEKCFARNICGGGCPMQREYMNFKDIPHERMCNFTKGVLQKILTEEVFL